MKRALLPLAGIGLMLVIASSDTFGRGGGGRGGGGGGGGARGGGGGARPSAGAGRSPSLGGGGGNYSRPSGGGTARPNTGAVTRPNTGAITPRPNTGAISRPNVGSNVGAVTRPSTGDVGRFLDIQAPATGAIGAGNIGGGNVAGGGFFEGGRASQLPAGGAGIASRPGVGNGDRTGIGSALQNRGNLANNRPDRIDNRQQRQGDRQQRRDQVRDQVRDNHPQLNFWSQYPNWAAWRINRPYRWATWAAITGWFGAGWGEPVYYNYGDNVYYSGDQVIYGDQPAATADAYADQAEAIASSAPQGNPQDSEWMPLGVFAVTQDGAANGAVPTIYVQLAVNKAAVINGFVNNTATGDTQPLVGKVDKTTQRAAWEINGKQFPVMETGIFSLTQDAAPALIHFADGQTQQWLLVRLPDPTTPSTSQ